MLTPLKLFVIWLFGLTSGFTLMITGNTLNYWLAKENIDLQSIGMFAFIIMPYSINFLWAPIFDIIHLGQLSKLLGHRLSWICLIQILLAFTIFLLSTMNPHHSLILFALVGLIISFLSSAKDSILGAFRTEIIAKESQGAASGIYIFGYRIGMLISSSGAIYLSSYLGWNNIYKIFAISVLVCSAILVTSILRLEHDLASKTYPDHKINISNFVQNILRPVGSFSLVFLIIVFLILYRLPDDFITMMMNPFLIHLGYNEFEIASAGKFFGIISTIIGGLIASLVMKKKNILDSLLIFGVIHAIAHTSLIVHEIYGKNLPLFFITTVCEGITCGMAMTAYIAFIASICTGKFRATQYSFFSSMMGFSRSIFPALSGYIVVQFGWKSFFTFIIIITIPSLLLLLKISSLLKAKMKY
ncbi:AmpG family muropeptide MFS transporter [Candidatus Tisiphia endosymbiont of Ptychoptera albimana]|uniref:AmpG family muropeptide MFS transporter n=1 Tax=Candidatus Tisiphia endosymbiont of Ptychoptera albimana TaxID=3066260 RepID=UPI00312CB2F6